MDVTKLPVDILRHIISYLGETSKQAFASSHSILWSKTTRVKTTTPLDLIDKTITAFQLETTTAIRLLNISYTDSFMQHVIRYSKSLKVIQIKPRNEYSSAFRQSVQKWFSNKQVKYDDGSIDECAPNPDETVTPDSVKRKLERLKVILKRDHMKESRSYQLKGNAGCQLPCYLNQYWLLSDYAMIDSDIKMNSKGKLTARQAKALINHFGSLLVNSIGIIDEHFFIITSHSVFLHKHDSIDDCASKSGIAFQDKPVMYIRKHKRYTHDYFELSVRIGHLEFLATGGFWGPLDRKTLTPFLGSSLSSLPSTITEDIGNPKSTTIFTTYATNPPVRTNRIMNQYLKSASTNKWGFHSPYFYSKDFFPTNPLEFDCSSAYHRTSSLLLKSYANRVLCDKLKSTFNEITKPPTSKAQKMIYDLAKSTVTKGSSPFSLNKKELTEKRAQLIAIYNHSLMHALKRSNIKKQEKAKATFKVKQINLFD